MEHVYGTDLKLLRCFLVVVEESYFGRTTARLNMSQPLFSIHIKELENQLGIQFFIRHSHNVVLTHAGKILMEESRRLLVNTNNVLTRVKQIGQEEAGRIELDVVGMAVWGRIRPAMRWSLRENPNIDVLFRKKMSIMQMALLGRRELDTGIWRMVTELSAGFTSLRLYKSAFLVTISEGHHLSSFSTVLLEALYDEHFVTTPPVCTDWDFLQRACQQVRFSLVVICGINEP